MEAIRFAGLIKKGAPDKEGFSGMKKCFIMTQYLFLDIYIVGAKYIRRKKTHDFSAGD